MPDPVERTVTSAQLAKEFGLQPLTVNKWPKAECPATHLGRGRGRGYRFNLVEVRQWLAETGRRTAHGGTNQGDDVSDGDLKEQIHRANLRKAIAMARRYELDVEIRRGKLLEREEVERHQVECISYARSRLMGGPSSLAPDLVGEDLETIEGLLAQWVMDTLTDLASPGDGSKMGGSD